MDPNEALRNILRGYEVADHIEALFGWLSNGGFEPEIILGDEEDWPYLDCLFVEFAKIIRANIDGVQYFAVHTDGREELISTTEWLVVRRETADDDIDALEKITDPHDYLDQCVLQDIEIAQAKFGEKLTDKIIIEVFVRHLAVVIKMKTTMSKADKFKLAAESLANRVTRN